MPFSDNPVFYRALLTATIAWLSILFAFSPFDLQISLASIDHDNPLAQLVSTYGEWPAWLLAIASLANVIIGWVWRRPFLFRLLSRCILLHAIVGPLAVTQFLKRCWGRVRFNDLGEGFSEYTAFFIPSGPGAGSSFPSGHVAMASICLCLPWYFVLTGRRRVGLLFALPVSVYIGVVAWGRIVSGHHYLTDVLFSGGLGLLLAPLIVHRVTKGNQFPSSRPEDEPSSQRG